MTALITTEPPADTPPADTPPADTPPADDLASLFTPEDIAARKEAIVASKAEEDRRAALTDEQRATEDAAKAAEEAAKGVPEKYEFKAPAGVVLDPVLVDEFSTIAKGLNLPQAEAQKLVDMGSKIVQRLTDGMLAQHDERVAGWLKEAESDPEIGADVKLGKDSVAIRAFNSVTGGDPKAKAMVDELGIGNHPEFIRVFYKISQLIREDGFVLPGAGAEASGSIAKALYPGMK